MKKGFTLAEVLITLGIIGVVAAMTLPTLISHHKKQVVETRLAKFYSSISQATKLSEVDNGEPKYWEDLTENNTLEWYNKYYKKYLKTLEDDTLDLTTAPDNLRSAINVYFNDGSLMFIQKQAVYFYPEAKNYEKCHNLINDWVLPAKACSGERYFVFLVDKERGIIPFASQLNLDDFKPDDPMQGCIKKPTNERANCTTVIMKNGWKIPKDYPIKF